MISSTEEIKSRINIVDLIGEYVRLTKAGANWKARCPFHNEKTPSFMVSEDKQIWHCFGCQKGGDIFGFVMEIEGMEFKEALKFLAEKSGVKLPEYRKEYHKEASKVPEILELATKFYEKQLWDGVGKNKILGYLYERGLKNETIKEFRLGYAPNGWRNLLTFLIDRGYKIEEIAGTGLLVKRNNDQDANKSQISNLKPENSKETTNYQLPATSYYDRFRDRIIFPISDINGKVVGFSARVAPGEDESQAKYVNTPETEVYHKSKILYGIDKARREIKSKNFVLLVEGNLDVMAASQAGLKNTVAVSGTALTPDHLDILKRYTENIKMFFDADSAGQIAARRSAELCFQKDISVFIVKPKLGKDAADVAQNNPEELENAVNEAVPAAEYFFGVILAKYDKTKAEGKKAIAKDTLNLIRNFQNEIDRSHWVKKLSREIEVEEKALLDVLGKASLKRTAGRFRREDNKEREISLGSRAEKIREKIIGLMLAEPAVWEKMENFEDQEIKAFLRGDKLFEEILRMGPECEFKYESLTPRLTGKEVQKKAIRLNFETKYQFGETDEVEVKEESLGNVNEMLEQYLDDIKKEICKEKLKKIVQDLSKAEKSGDREAVKFLMVEFSKISQKLK